MGHVVDKCYKLHGYPLGYKFKDKGQASTNSIVISAIDNIVDDNVSLTRTKYQLFLSLLNSQSHFGTQGPQDLASKSHQVANIIAQPTMGFAGHEMLGISFQNLSKLSINSLEYSVFSSHVKTTFITSIDWILDNGATDHMVHSIHLLSSITFLVHISVKLPNGDIVQVTHIGTVKLSTTLTLDNVLCVPTFSFNLISISKLT